jgi:hypothetical protein
MLMMHGIFISALCVAVFMGIRSAPAEVMLDIDCGSAKVQYSPSEDTLYPRKPPKVRASI